MIVVKGILHATGRKDPKASIRLVIPALVRRELKLEIGSVLAYEVIDGKFILTPIKEEDHASGKD